MSKPTRSVANPEGLLEVNTVAFHENDSVTRTYLQIINENLLYRRPDTSKAFYSELRIFFRLLSEVHSKTSLDSGSFFLFDRSPNEQVTVKPLYAEFEINAKRGNNYYLEIEVLDMNRKIRYHTELNIYKETKFTGQNFLVTRHDSVIFKNTFLEGNEVIIKIADPAVSKVTVDCFFKDFGPALPPFSTRPPDEFKYKPDSVFTENYITRQFSLRMPSRGFYHIKADPNSNEGLTLYTMDETFPGVSNSLEMINCTRYIMFREEYEQCRDAADKKAAIDAFWLNVGGSLERARELLKRYYSRVKEANKLYTSYTQGWKTDRGMIYIVMGPPANVYRSKKDEIWMYGNETNPNALRFVFNKTKNPFSDNDFILERSPFYKESYHTAVEYWRQGLIYIDNRR